MYTTSYRFITLGRLYITHVMGLENGDDRIDQPTNRWARLRCGPVGYPSPISPVGRIHRETVTEWRRPL